MAMKQFALLALTATLQLHMVQCYSAHQLIYVNEADQTESQDLHHVRRALVGGREPRARGYNHMPYSIDESGRNIVGLSWFAPAVEVAPLECQATNGALDVGTCHSDTTCSSNGGVASGICATGGVCCIFPTVCGGIVTRNRTWFVNKDFPEFTRDPTDCRLTIKRTDSKVKQVRLDFVVTELGDAVQGRCHRDSLTVRRANDNSNLIPHLCGDNSGQHVYIDLGYQDVELVLKMSETLNRKWHILVTQIAPDNEVPTGCLQYFSDPTAIVKSLNYDSGSFLYKGDLDYDICFPSFDSPNIRNTGCERIASDIDLRQADNDIRTKRTRPQHKIRRGRSANLPIVRAFGTLQPNRRIKNMRSPTFNNPGRSRSMSSSFALTGDPVYSQLDHVMSQLRNPASSGLESLLKSRSQLDAMGEEYGKRDDVSNDVYYYYYYEDDPNLSDNGIDEFDDRRVTDNYAVEHMNREFAVLPDGSPIPNRFFSNHPSTGFNAEKYFHTGMIEDITSGYEKEDTTETQYPTPTWYQRPTTPKINLLKPELPVASILVYDPMLHSTNGDLVYADPYSQKSKPSVTNSPTQFTFKDLTTLSSINPEDEYNLKHDGVQWLFLKKESSTTTPSIQSTTNRLNLPHGITLSTASAVGKKPHLIFKHPSGTITEMHITPGSSDNSAEKIVTVIETGPLMQNYTKIKIDDISQLDKVIENVFNIVSDTEEGSNAAVTDNVRSTYTKSSPSSTVAGTTLDFRTPETIFYTKLSPEELKITTSKGIGEDLLTTIFNTRLTGEPTSEGTRVEIHHLNKKPVVTRPTGRPKVTRIVTRPMMRFSSKPSTDAARLTTSQYQSTTPSTATTHFNGPWSTPNVRYTNIAQSNRPMTTGVNHVSVNQGTSLGTQVPNRLYTMIRQGNTNPSPTSSFQATETETTIQDKIKSTIPAFIVQNTTPNDPFTEMLNNIGVDTSTSEPVFTISTKSHNGQVTTKTYTTVEEAMSDLQNRRTTSQGSESGLPLQFTTQPFSIGSNTEPTHNTFEETTITEDLRNLIINSDNEELAFFNNDVCEYSYLKVNNFKICDQLLRSEPIRDDVQDLFNNMNRISVRSYGDSTKALRFSLKYETVCTPESMTTPRNRGTTRASSTTTGAPEVKTVNLLQYLLGWYR